MLGKASVQSQMYAHLDMMQPVAVSIILHTIAATARRWSCELSK